MQRNILNPLPTQPMSSALPTKKIYNAPKPGQSFAETLKETIHVKKEMLSISKHADFRLKQRNISISPQTWKEVESKVALAKEKGVKEPLVLLKNAALIISAKNGIVITAMDRQEAGSQIFTNIDGTIIID
ncbi:TIGR02530 family flagellar biosynthesis protein [Rossellomorea vietnamensis]|uniref:Flagellar protein n=1 Tax=Rossellomorea aquimaris TaxID=189382 RepID=A0A5D4U564_9BACI|nr:TIGR02530 family flagellar biosynthesis protein [Rossellomorea aquimaris]TYS82465.1 flagellar protein [Rossellomorea aquimaris]